jgi:hypothetical protein
MPASLKKSPDEIAEEIGRFLASAARPAVMEPGQDPIFLIRTNFSLEARGSLLNFSCWTDTANLVRRIQAVKTSRTGRLELEYERFGGRVGVLALVDLAHPSNRDAPRRGARLKYREVFRTALRRQFVDWKIVELSAEQDLEHSLSPSYPRALLKKGNSAWAAIGAGAESLDPDGALSFGLIWLDYLRKREKQLGVEGLAIFQVAGREATTCHRVRHLDTGAACYRVFIHHSDGLEDGVDPRDYTNLNTRLDPCGTALGRTSSELAGWLEGLASIEGVARREHGDGSASLAVRGLEFARTREGALLFGLDRQKHIATHAHLEEIAELARGIASMRRTNAADRTNPLYRLQPEAWLESQARASIQQLEATLHPQPVYGQVPQFAGGERGVIDLLAVDVTGRLAVLELKATQDIHLPLQALDYWMRVKWHLEQGDLTRAGYFPGVPLTAQPPRLFLVAPALDFHPSNETILRYLAPEVQVERIGIGLEWRQELRVMFRSGPKKSWRLQSSGS